MSRVSDQLYVGNIYDAINIEWLEQHNITHIVNCIKGFDNLYPREFKYLSLHLDDQPQQTLYHVFEPSYKFIRDAIHNGGTVLVHCHAGVSRAASITIYFLMKVKGWSYVEALQYLRKFRPIVNPNPGFVKQLISVSPKQ